MKVLPGRIRRLRTQRRVRREGRRFAATLGFMRSPLSNTRVTILEKSAPDPEGRMYPRLRLSLGSKWEPVKNPFGIWIFKNKQGKYLAVIYPEGQANDLHEYAHIRQIMFYDRLGARHPMPLRANTMLSNFEDGLFRGMGYGKSNEPEDMVRSMKSLEGVVTNQSIYTYISSVEPTVSTRTILRLGTQIAQAYPSPTLLLRALARMYKIPSLRDTLAKLNRDQGYTAQKKDVAAIANYFLNYARIHGKE